MATSVVSFARFRMKLSWFAEEYKSLKESQQNNWESTSSNSSSASVIPFQNEPESKHQEIIKELEERNRCLEDKVVAISIERNRVENELKEHDISGISHYRKSMELLNQSKYSLEQDLKEKKAEIQVLKNSKLQFDQACDSFEKNFTVISDRISFLTVRMEQHDQIVSALKSTHEKLSSSWQSSIGHALILGERVKSYREKIRNLREEAANQQAIIEASQRQLDEARSEIDRLKKQQELTDQRAELLQQENKENLERLLKDSEFRVNSLKSISKLEQESDDLRTEIAKLRQSSIEESSKSQDVLVIEKTKNFSYESTIEELRASSAQMTARYQDEIAILRQDLAAERECHQKSSTELDDIKKILHEEQERGQQYASMMDGQLQDARDELEKSRREIEILTSAKDKGTKLIYDAEDAQKKRKLNLANPFENF